jgi:hypothetical protein
VSFQVIGPWSKPERKQPSRWTAEEGFTTAFFICTLSLSAFLAWRNIRLGRGDTRGAFRLAAFILNFELLAWLCSASHVPTAHELVAFLEIFAVAFASAGRAWLFYVALEPYVRRRLPQIMITWSRLLGGGVRDPLVGGHLLIGAAFGVGFAALGLVVFRLVQQLSGNPSPEWRPSLASMLDARHMTFVLIVVALGAVFGSLLLLLFLFLFRSLFRRLWLAAAALILLIIAVFSPTNLPDFCAAVIFAAVIAFILIRFGVMALMAAIFVWQILLFFPLTTDLTTWFASSSLFAIASILALTAYSGYTALAGRPLFQAGFLESD